MSKVLINTKDPFDVIASAVKKAGAAVRPTYGPASNKVIIDKQTHRMVVDDGVQIMRDLEFEDKQENAVLKVVRETAIKTNDRVGDGTTGAVILVDDVIGQIADMPHRDGHAIERELKQGAKEAVEQLKAMARTVKTRDELIKVARVSYDDAAIAEVIADAWHKVGVDGDVTIEESALPETVSDISDGVQLKGRGYISPFMVTNPQRMEAVLEKPLFLVTDYRLTNSEDVLPLLNVVAQAGRNKVVIISEHIEDAALATLIINLPQVMNPHTGKPGVVQSVAVNAPQADNMQVALADIALLLGARFFSMKKGDKLDDIKLDDLGKADRFISNRDKSVIVRPRGDAKVVAKAIVDLKFARDEETDEATKKGIQRRLNMLTNQVAVIKVGAETDNERKAKKYKVEDAVHSVKAAFKSGVVPGGGVALASLETSSPLLNHALKRPQKQLYENSGVAAPVLKKGEAFNVVSGQKGPYMQVGVMDPVDVLVAAVESATSIASLLATVSGMIVEVPPEPRRE